MANKVVESSDQLWPAINQAVAGDTIGIKPLVVCTGNFIIPSGIRLQSTASLPTRRIGPGDKSLLPVIRSGNGDSALMMPGAQGVHIDGICLEANDGGHGDVVKLDDGLDVTFKRILVDLPDPQEQKRVIRGNGRNIVLEDSHIAGVWRAGQDSQAFCAWSGPGPYTIRRNYLEAASENVMFGGADSKSYDDIPADILVEDNHFSKRLIWKGNSRNVKNLFETKQAKRVLIRRNLFEHCWKDGQTGWGIVFKSMNDTGRSPWAVSEDITFENNIVRNVQNGISLVGRDPYQVSGQMTRITIRNVVLHVESGGFKMGVEVGEVLIDHLTMDNPGTTILMNLGGFMTSAGLQPSQYSVEKLTIQNSIMFGLPYGIKAEGGQIGTDSLVKGTKSYVFTKNVVAGGGGSYPSGTVRPTPDELRAMLTLDYKLVESSPYRNAGTDGRDLGATLTMAFPGPTPDPVPTPEPEPEPEPLPPGAVLFEGSVWSFGTNHETLRDGVRFANGSGFEYLIYNARLFVLGTDNRWYRKEESSWSLHGTTRPGETDPLPPLPPVDTEGPVLSLTIIQSGNSPNYELSADAKDPAGIARVDFYVGAEHVGFATAPETSGGSVYRVKAFIRQSGTYTVRAMAWDVVGNVREATKTLKR